MDASQHLSYEDQDTRDSRSRRVSAASYDHVEETDVDALFMIGLEEEELEATAGEQEDVDSADSDSDDTATAKMVRYLRKLSGSPRSSVGTSQTHQEQLLRRNTDSSAFAFGNVPHDDESDACPDLSSYLSEEDVDPCAV